MTLLLASVTSPEEAEIAIAHGADIIDVNGASTVALGMPELAGVRAAVVAIAGRRPVSAATGDLPMEPARIADAVATMAQAGVDYVRVKLFPDAKRDDCIRALSALASRIKIIAVMFADHGDQDGDQDDAHLALAPLLAECGFAGALLDTAHKHAGRLLDHMDITALADFTEAFRSRGLLTGLAGSLEAPDIPRLLLIAPDFLGFRGALCAKHDPAAGIDPQAIDVIRALIPTQTQAPAQAHSATAKVDYRLISPRASVDAGKDGATTDRVFVRDFVLPVRMGAYGRERGKAQNVRFSVDAKIARLAHAVEDMRDVFSYDVITDGIRMIVAREHIAFVEMLAERIAALLLAHARVTSVTVRVEKLDVGPGAVGVEITRERPAEAAAVRHLFPVAGRESEPKAAD